MQAVREWLGSAVPTVMSIWLFCALTNHFQMVWWTRSCTNLHLAIHYICCLPASQFLRMCCVGACFKCFPHVFFGMHAFHIFILAYASLRHYRATVCWTRDFRVNDVMSSPPGQSAHASQIPQPALNVEFWYLSPPSMSNSGKPGVALVHVSSIVPCTFRHAPFPER